MSISRLKISLNFSLLDAITRALRLQVKGELAYSISKKVEILNRGELWKRG